MSSDLVNLLSNNDGVLTIGIIDRVDTNNAAEIEKQIDSILNENNYNQLVLDLSELNYISSVGIRILMKLIKNNPGFKIENTSNDVFGILEMTGINKVIPISKKLREISIDGKEKIGVGFNGAVYRLDDETIVKVMNDNVDLNLINNERNLSQKAFLLGIPSAISFDVVKVGDNYGIVYELLNSESYGSRIQNNPDQLFELGKRFGAFGRKINSVKVDDESFGSAKERLLKQLEGFKLKFNEEDFNLIKDVLEALPEGDNFVHGDFHPENVLIQNDEPLLIDMATTGKGHPLNDIITFANPIIGSVYSKPDDNFVSVYNHLTKAQNDELYDGFLQGYFDTDDQEYLEKVNKQIFPFMLIKRALGLCRYLPDITQETEEIPYTRENENSRIVDLSQKVLADGLKECLKDMKESFDELEFPLDF